jgi:hypothetical protein
MRCPACGHEFKSPVAVAGGEAGGKARVAKGFASPRVQALALKTRKRNARAKRSPNATEQARAGSASPGSAGSASDSEGR